MSTLERLRNAESLHDLAEILGYTPKGLGYLAYGMEKSKKYEVFKIDKKSGGKRTISAPVPELKKLQKHLANALYLCRSEIEKEIIENKKGGALKPVSHAYRKELSIITNANVHKNRRYVLNIDLKDFFPSINFGRVRGYFINNKHFKIDSDVATVIAQIACHDDELPQGSPCSPIISDLVGGILDYRLISLATDCKVTYSRYADDITFSTNLKNFPKGIAKYSKKKKKWILSDDLKQAVSRAGFSVNNKKIRMQYRSSRQSVTGLLVNSNVNIKPEYYRNLRAMSHSLFHTGEYYLPEDADKKTIESLEKLRGMLSFAYLVKSKNFPEARQGGFNGRAIEELFAKFLWFQYFLKSPKPLIICEGKTDNIYLKLAIRNLPKFQPLLGEVESQKVKYNVNFFNYENLSSEVLGLTGGGSPLAGFVGTYQKKRKQYSADVEPKPVIVIVDNDSGSSDIFGSIKRNFDKKISLDSSEPFYHIGDHLYLIKTPNSLGSSLESKIEDLFDPSLLNEELRGKVFCSDNNKKKFDSEKHYGKAYFANQVILPKAQSIDWKNFELLLDPITQVLSHHKSLKTN